MRAVVQRVRRAAVRVADEVVGQIGPGLLVYIAAATGDTDRDVSYMARKVARLRIFPDDERPLNRSVVDADGSALVVSQFTLYGDCRRGRRPSFNAAMEPREAARAIDRFIEGLEELGVPTATGIFQAMMDVESTNWGPVTILLDGKKHF